MIVDPNGRTALVTRSTTGIGEAIARSLVAAGAEVVVNGLRPAKGSDVAMRLHARGIAADVSAAEGARSLISQVPDVDILVNDVGSYAAQPVFEIDDAGWRGVFDDRAARCRPRHRAGTRRHRGYRQQRSGGADDERRRSGHVGNIFPDLSRKEQEVRFVAQPCRQLPARRVIRPEEVATLVTYLASDYSSATTARALGVDGGLVPAIIP